MDINYYIKILMENRRAVHKLKEFKLFYQNHGGNEAIVYLLIP